MKTVNLNSVTLKKNGTPISLIGVTDKEKPWTLKGMITTENKDGGCVVDLTGCTELFVKAYCIVTANTSLYAENSYLAYNSFKQANKWFFAKWEDSQFGIDNTMAKISNGGSSAGDYSVSAYSWFDGKHVSDISNIRFNTPANVTECNIEIYAR